MGAEIYGAAADRDQASIVFQLAASMVRANPKLRNRSKVIDSSKRIIVSRVESFYRALSAEVAGKLGFNSHGVIFDEIHAQKDRQLWEVLTFGAGAARTQPPILWYHYGRNSRRIASSGGTARSGRPDSVMLQ